MSTQKENEKRIREYVENSWLNLGKDYPMNKRIDNPFLHRTKEEIENPLKDILGIFYDPKNLYFTVKHLFGIELLPFQLVILQELWTRKYPMLVASRGAGKSFILGLYSMLRAFLHQGSKVVVVGSGFRQSKVIFDYAERIWNNAPVLRSICNQASKSGPSHAADMYTMTLGESYISALPIGDGSKIRGQRANYIIGDEFASMNEEIYENVISGFAAVSANPVDQVKDRAYKAAMAEMGMVNDSYDSSTEMGNQAVISGTAYYDFNLFAKYWKRYKAIIKSKGDSHKLKEMFPDGIPTSFDWRDYSIIRIPVDSLPPGFMDEKHVARSKATIHSGLYAMEFGAVFSSDSNGFFKRSLVESCVTTTPINIDGQDIQFHADIKGNKSLKYIYGIDPASQIDNFSIVIIELHETHRRIIYSWTTNKSKHKEEMKSGLVKEQDYYGYCARKIRDLMKVFPCERIALDSQGGGFAIEEALHDPDKYNHDEKPIWRIIEEDKPQDTDDYPGLHIIELINFAKADWVSNANHGLRKDFEDKVLLFPYHDPLSIGFAIEEDKRLKRVGGSNTLENCVDEIEELKDELATIVHTQTSTSGRDRWDTPEIKVAGGKKGRMRKDRYSALLMANMVARTLDRTPEPLVFNHIGGYVGDAKAFTGGAMYQGPEWFTQPTFNGGFCGVVRRGV